mgnify:CR=1 FL=1
MHIGFRLFSLIATLLFSLHLAAQENLYQRWDGKSSRQLIDLGNQYFFAEKQQPDSALVCFSLVENRLGKASGREEREELCEAYMGLWMVYFFSYFDYSKSMDYLGKSNKLAEGLPELLPRVLLNYGNMYQTMGSQWADDNLNRKAADCFYKAFHAAVRVKLYDVADLAFANVIAVEWSLGQFAVVEKMYPKYLEYSAGRKETVDSRYTKLLYQGYKQLSHKQPLRAVETFKRQLPIVSTGVEYLRLLFNAHENIALAYASAGDYGSAVANMRKAEALARRYDLKDGKLEVYSYLRQYLRKGGWTAEAEAYQRRYYQLKDSLQNYQQVMGVSKLEFLGKIEDARQELEEMQQRQRVSMVLLVVALCVAGVVAVSLSVVYRKNRQLSAANKVLYKKNIEVQDAEAQLRRLHQEEMEKNAVLKTVGTAGGKAAEGAQETGKYKKSGLSEDAKDNMMERIKTAMESCEEIYSPEFSINTLAQLLDTNYKYVSQVINERTNGNFSTFVNTYRIKEACRRINGGIMKNYTIEALSNSVGFRSRMSFFKAFKLQTGLTPSEYIRQRRESQG